jgi:hypothetical protein
MSMQDAFQYFTRMAQLVAMDSAAGAQSAAPAVPLAARRHSDGRGLARLIRIVRPRRRAAAETAHVTTLAVERDKEHSAAA